MDNFKCAYDKIVDVVGLVQNPKNPNKHPQKQIEMLAKIIKYQGQRAPIVVSNRSGFITKGHGRLEALKLLGWEKAAVDFQDYEDDQQEFADMVADNKIAELAEHDDEFMLDSIKELGLEDIDFDLLGLNDFSFALPDEALLDDKPEQEQVIKYKIEVEFPNDMEMRDIYDDLLNRGYIVKVIK